jgi:Fic family protein
MRLMRPSERPYLWQQPSWPTFSFDAQKVSASLAQARLVQGEVEGKAHAIGLDSTGGIVPEILAQEVVASAAIEGEQLDPAAVLSSVMRHLGLADVGPYDRHVDGMVQVITDASEQFAAPLDHDRLCRWQSALFPGGASGLRRIAVGRYRDHTEPMQIVSGHPDKEVVHYVAPPSSAVPAEMTKFLAWFSNTTPGADQPQAIDGIARAAIAHLWFETIHPFEDGNGRVGRAIVDMAVAQDHRAPARLYSLSQQLLESRGGYYDALNQAQRSEGEVTAWVTWFAQQFAAACRRSSELIDRVIEKNRFWSEHSTTELNGRQRKVLQRLLDDGDGGFLGGLNAEKYMKMTGASKATATRDLAGLLAFGMLRTTGQGKATRYYVNVPGWSHGL